jgi:hypothetical protein
VHGDLGQQLLLHPIEPGTLLLQHDQRVHPPLLRQRTEVGRTQASQFHQAGLHRREPIHHRLTEIDELSITGEPDRAQLRPEEHATIRPIPLRRRLRRIIDLERRKVPLRSIELGLVHTRKCNRTRSSASDSPYCIRRISYHNTLTEPEASGLQADLPVDRLEGDICPVLATWQLD